MTDTSKKTKNKKTNNNNIDIKNDMSTAQNVKEGLKKEENKMDKVNKTDRVFFGDSKEVISVDHQDYNDFVNNTEKKQDLKGFDEEYRDIVDYILKITHRIWEEKGIGVIYDTYHNDVTMHTSSTNLVGIKDVVANTLMTLHAFPDRRLIGEEVVWSDYDTNGFLSSHRVLSTATNLGDSNFGKATGKKVNFRTVIDCAIENNRIYEEWLVRDNLWLVQQLGLDVHEVAKKMAKANALKVPALQNEYGLAESMYGQFVPTRYKAKDDSVGEWIKEVLDEMYNYKMINKAKEHYAADAIVHNICNQDLYGYENIQGMMISFLGSIPNGHYYVDRVTVNDRRGDESYTVAVRWRMKGLHEGIGVFGDPSFKPLNILGITHYRIENKKIAEEWITYDGLDVLRQTYQEKEYTETE